MEHQTPPLPRAAIINASFACRDWLSQQRIQAQSRLISITDQAVDNLIEAIRDRKDVKASQFLLKLVAAEKRGR